MKITTIKNALENYLNTVIDETERVDILDSISECQNVIDRFYGRDIWKDEVYLTTPDSLPNLISDFTYDEFGRQMKTLGNVTFEQYSDIVIKKYLMDDLTDRIIRHSYDITRDLWSDNEEYGENNPDGTFNYDLHW